MFISIKGFPLTIAPISIAFFFLHHFRITLNTTKIILFPIVFFWPVVILLIYSKFVKSVEITEFISTYLLWVFGASILLMATVSHLSKVKNYSNVYKAALFIIVCFSLIQVLLVIIFDSTFLYNPFRGFTYLSEYNLSRIFSNTGPRAYGLFLEPSFNAFMIFFLVSALLMGDKNEGKAFVYFLGSIGLLFTASASGILLTLGLFFLLIWLKIFRNNVVRVVLLLILPLVFVVLIPDSLLTRLNEVNVEGTSGYWRLIAPVIIITNALSIMPMGIPFGQINEFVLSLDLNHGGYAGSSLDNGLAVLLFYFGLVAFIFLAVILYKLISAIYFRNKEGVIFWWYVLASLQFSGGIFLPEYILPMILMIYQYKKSKYLMNS
jgi:putative colanic acid polymerase